MQLVIYLCNSLDVNLYSTMEKKTHTHTHTHAHLGHIENSHGCAIMKMLLVFRCLCGSRSIEPSHRALQLGVMPHNFIQLIFLECPIVGILFAAS